MQTFPETDRVYCEDLSEFDEHAACFNCGRCDCEVKVYDGSDRYGRSCLDCEQQAAEWDAIYAANEAG